MAFSVTQAVGNTSTASATTVAVTISATASGAMIVVGASNHGTRTVSSVTDSQTNTYVQATNAAGSCNTALDATDIWYCLSPASGVTSVTVTFSGAAGTFTKDAEVWEVAKPTEGAIFDLGGNVSNTSTSDGTEEGPSLTTTSATGFIAAINRTTVGSSCTANPHAGNEFSSGGDIVSADCGAVSLISSTAAAHQPVWDTGNTFIEHCSSAAAFKVAPTVAVTGTATATITEADVVTGGKTVILTVTGGTYVDNLASIVYVGGQTGKFAGTTSAQTITFALTNGAASTPAAGDLVIITYAVGSTADRSLAIRNTGATDYTLMGSELYQNDTFDANQRTAYRFMPSPTETQFVLTETVGGGTGSIQDAGVWTVHVFRNVDTGTPMDVTVVTAGAIDGSGVDPGSITPTTSGAVVYAAGAAASGTGSTMTSSDLTDFRPNTQADTNDISIGAGYSTWTSGALNPAAYGSIPGGTTANSWTAITAALRPATDSAFDNARAGIRDGVDSAQSEGTGWDALKTTTMPVGNVVRTSATVVTITLAAAGTYNITAQETITATVPAAALTENVAVVATPTFTVDTSGGGGGTAVPVFYMHRVSQGMA